MKLQIIKTLAVSTLVALAAGCSTVAPPVNEAKPAPMSSYHIVSPPASPELATVVFVRDTGLLGSAGSKHVLINGKKAVSLATGEKATLNLAPDEYIFMVTNVDPFNISGFFSIEQNLKAGKTYHYRIFADGNTFNTYIQRFYADGER